MIGINSYFSPFEEKLITRIRLITDKCNLDNISRTNAYLRYYNKNQEIQWAFLASQVSRNAGWNMCDLNGRWLPQLVSQKKRQQIYLTYEKANWLIFKDAYPQLLLYEYSTKINAPMFHLLKVFQVSTFMEQEWLGFWENKDKQRLMNSLIINEQNVIQKPVIKNARIKHHIFHYLPYLFQDLLHFNAVLFPTLQGKLYGASVANFTSLDERIKLGNTLAALLFKNNLYQEFYDFARKIEHTGSRKDYEKYIYPKIANTTPILRAVYPVVNHRNRAREDWYKKKIKHKWRISSNHNEPFLITDWYFKKQEQLHELIRQENKWF
ncbi:DUF2515 family protein [Niallia sp. JL1B1071]|uniref:DUF2515 family protein n=1 Tax=Niallia tiangongensis TaxID=3237105 RepID=UPI0037DC3EA9